MADRILVPYDGSPQSRAALELVFEEFPDGDVTALYVIEIPQGYWAQLIGPNSSFPSASRSKNTPKNSSSRRATSQRNTDGTWRQRT